MPTISRITSVAGGKSLPPVPEDMDGGIGYDFNRGSGGKYVGVYYAYGDDAITDIRVSGDDNENNARNKAVADGFQIVGGDLNIGSGGQYISMSVRKDGDKRVKKIGVVDGKKDSKPAGWDDWSPHDCNKGSGGRYIYLVWDYE